MDRSSPATKAFHSFDRYALMLFGKFHSLPRSTAKRHHAMNCDFKHEGGERRIDVVEFLTVCQAIGADSAKLLKALKNAIANGDQRV